MHKMCKSEVQLTRCSIAPCSAFALGTVPQYHPHATERIVTLRLAQQRKITLKKFLEGTHHLDYYFNPLTTTQVNFILSFILTTVTRLPSSAKLELSLFSFFLLSLLEWLHQQDTFFSLTFIKERILSKIICHCVNCKRASTMFLHVLTSKTWAHLIVFKLA
jgi:hypothetical protein